MLNGFIWNTKQGTANLSFKTTLSSSKCPLYNLESKFLSLHIFAMHGNYVSVFLFKFDFQSNNLLLNALIELIKVDTYLSSPWSSRFKAWSFCEASVDMLITNCRPENQQPGSLFDKYFDIISQVYKTLQYFTFADYFTSVADTRTLNLVSTS